jgi:hypothetical protein
VLLSRTQIAVTAFAALEKLIRNENDKPEYVIATRLVLRASTAIYSPE